MNMIESDLELLARYRQNTAEDAFAELVRRHLGLVHSAALRQVRSPQLAEEVAQVTFINLARHAGRLAPDTILAAWLYQVTRREAIEVIRREVRRQLREQIFIDMNATNVIANDWTHLEPLLDEGMQALAEPDRAAVLLRYFENKSLREVGATLGVTEDAAQKRVSRAVDHLSEFLSKRGVATGASGLAILISANAAQAVPIGLIDSISTAAMLVQASKNAAVIQTIAMTTLHKTLISACVLLFVGAGIYKAYEANHTQGKALRLSVVARAADQPSGKVMEQNGLRVRSLSPSRAKDPKQIARLIAELKTALHHPASKLGVRAYPPEEVLRAIANFGRDRKEAFAILKTAASDADLEVRLRAVTGMGLVGKRANTELPGDPAPEAKPFLLNILKGDGEEAYFALLAAQNIGFDPRDIPDLASLLSITTNEGLKRYLPEAISATINKDAAGAGPYLSTVQALLKSPVAEVQFEAACALATSEAPHDPQFLQKLTAGLGMNNLQQLMALETLERLGSSAEPAIQAILDYSNSTKDAGMRDVALKAIRKIKPDLRNELPGVNEALKPEETMAYWNEKLSNGNYTYEDLLAALKVPPFAAIAAKLLGETGPSAKSVVPNLIAALAGQDQDRRDQIMGAIHQIDPETTVTKINSLSVANAAILASLTLEGQPEAQRPPELAKLLENARKGNSTWFSQQEVMELGKQIAGRDQEVYNAFVTKLTEVEPALARLFAETQPTQPAK